MLDENASLKEHQTRLNLKLFEWKGTVDQSLESQEKLNVSFEKSIGELRCELTRLKIKVYAVCGVISIIGPVAVTLLSKLL